jgi:glucuronate isomerase
MNAFIRPDFLLKTKTAQQLYHQFAADCPIIDYHCHLNPELIAENANFPNLTQAWLYGDHYKWRAMRANGIDEDFITGNASDKDKFEKWADTVPYTLRNPLFHWTHLELKRYFGIDDLLCQKTSASIYKNSSEQLGQADFSVPNLLRKMNVEVVCTTDDPVDPLTSHQTIKASVSDIKVLPGFRPDRALQINNGDAFRSYLELLRETTSLSVDTYFSFLDALKKRHDFFAANGCNVFDCGLEYIPLSINSEKECVQIFEKALTGKQVSLEEAEGFRGAVLVQIATWNAEKNWVQQFHLGALRNNNSRLMKKLGADSGVDSIGDFSHARSLSKFLSRLDENNSLARTILYNINPADSEVFASMAGNFNDGVIPGKIQYGAAWWFLDQKDGIIKQLDVLSNLGLLSRFVGMLTDSRSFLSFPRHEYFRRILCNVFGEEVENGELPNDIDWLGKIVKDICYFNAKQYFQW